jgi:hypothetical protein
VPRLLLLLFVLRPAQECHGGGSRRRMLWYPHLVRRKTLRSRRKLLAPCIRHGGDARREPVLPLLLAAAMALRHRVPMVRSLRVFGPTRRLRRAWGLTRRCCS